MKLTLEQKNHIDKCFDFHLNFFNKYMRIYQKELIETIEETEIKHNIVDEFFYYELVEQGFIEQIKKYAEREVKELERKKGFYKEINELL